MPVKYYVAADILQSMVKDISIVQVTSIDRAGVELTDLFIIYLYVTQAHVPLPGKPPEA